MFLGKLSRGFFVSRSSSGNGGLLGPARDMLGRKRFLYTRHERRWYQNSSCRCLLLQFGLHDERLSYSPLRNRIFLGFVGTTHSFYNVTLRRSFLSHHPTCKVLWRLNQTISVSPADHKCAFDNKAKCLVPFFLAFSTLQGCNAVA